MVDDATGAARRRRAEWPLATPAPTPATSLTLDAFHAEGDPTSHCEAAPRGGEGLHLQFRLAAPTETQRDTFCALVDRTPRALTGRQGLTLRIKADGVYRIWLQVRDENPASSDGGTEWWTASIKTSAEWQRVALPFSRFRSINPKSDGKLDLDKVQALVFVLDRGAIKPGTEGQVWIDELGSD